MNTQQKNECEKFGEGLEGQELEERLFEKCARVPFTIGGHVWRELVVDYENIIKYHNSFQQMTKEKFKPSNPSEATLLKLLNKYYDQMLDFDRSLNEYIKYIEKEHSKSIKKEEL